MEEQIIRLPKAINSKIVSSTVSDIGRSFTPDFTVDDDNKFLYNHMIKWVLADDRIESNDIENPQRKVKGFVNGNVYIASNTGCGKTMCVKIMMKLSQKENIKYAIGDYLFDFVWATVRADRICDYFMQHGDLYDFMNEPILAIDDLGVENQESIYMGNRVHVLRQLLEYRLDRADKLTIITSNLPINADEFMDKYGSRVVSKLQRCNYYELKGIDRRKRK